MYDRTTGGFVHEVKFLQIHDISLPKVEPDCHIAYNNQSQRPPTSISDLPLRPILNFLRLALNSCHIGYATWEEGAPTLRLVWLHLMKTYWFNLPQIINSTRDPQTKDFGPDGVIRRYLTLQSPHQSSPERNTSIKPSIHETLPHFLQSLALSFNRVTSLSGIRQMRYAVYSTND